MWHRAIAAGFVAALAGGPAAARYDPPRTEPIHPPDNPNRGFYARQAEYFRRQAEYFRPQYEYYDRMLERQRPVVRFVPFGAPFVSRSRPYEPYPDGAFIPYTPGLPLPPVEAAAAPPAARP